MYGELKTENVKQHLQLAKNRQKLDPRDTTETQIYIAHVEHLLLELESALFLNQLQSRNIRSYITRLEKTAELAGVKLNEHAAP
jgi:hypothetical protein